MKKNNPIIIIAEDDALMRKLLVHLLQKDEYEVIETENGKQCLNICYNIQPDLIILDGMMPEMDGFTCCQEISKILGKNQIPILILTALNDSESIERAFEVGAIDYMTKPLQPLVLRFRIRRLLEASFSAKALRESQQKLQAREQQYRSVITNIKEVIFQIDLNGKLSFLNQAWEKIMGLSIQESLGKLFSNFLIQDELIFYNEIIEKLLTKQIKEFSHVFRLINHKHNLLWVEIYFTVILDSQNNITGFLGTINDITNKKQQQKYQELEQEITQLFAEPLPLKITILKILEILSLNLQWDLGQLWIFNSPNHQVNCLATWFAQNKEIFVQEFNQQLMMKSNNQEPLIWQIWHQHNLIWLEDIQTQLETSPLVDLFKNQNELCFSSFLSILIGDSNKDLGLITFAHQNKHQYEPDSLQFLNNISSRLGQFIVHKQVEEDLQLLGKLLALRYQSYIVLDQDLIITKISDGAENFCNYPEYLELGNELDLIFPELEDKTDLFDSMIKGEIISFQQEIVIYLEANHQDDEHQKYINIYIVVNPHPNQLLFNNFFFLFFEEITEKVKLQQALEKEELKALQQLQKAANYVKYLLPNPLKENIKTKQCFIPCLELGGDFLDYYWLDQDHLVMYLLDVADHGVQSSLLSISIVNLLRTQSLYKSNFYQPSTVLAEINRVLQFYEGNNNHCTLWYGVYNQITRELCYSCAGHPPAILFSPQLEPESSFSYQKLDVGNMALGLFADLEYEEGTCIIPEKSSLYLYSDSAYEVYQSQDQILGLDGFISILKKYQLLSKDEQNLELIYYELLTISKQECLDDDFSILQIDFS